MKTTLLLFTVLFLSACGSMNPKDYHPRTMAYLGEKRVYEPVGQADYKYEDKEIKIAYEPDIVDAGISFIFQNKTDKVVKIIWDETVYLNPDGSSDRVFHNGVKIVERSGPQPPTVIPPGGMHSDQLVSVNNVDFSYSNWNYVPMCGKVQMFTDHKLQDDGCIGKTFGYYITYEVDGKKKAQTLKYKYLAKEQKQAKN